MLNIEPDIESMKLWNCLKVFRENLAVEKKLITNFQPNYRKIDQFPHVLFVPTTVQSEFFRVIIFFVVKKVEIHVIVYFKWYHRGRIMICVIM